MLIQRIYEGRNFLILKKFGTVVGVIDGNRHNFWIVQLIQLNKRSAIKIALVCPDLMIFVNSVNMLRYCEKFRTFLQRTPLNSILGIPLLAAKLAKQLITIIVVQLIIPTNSSKGLNPLKHIILCPLTSVTAFHSFTQRL